MRILVLACLLISAPAVARTYDLPATPQSVAWGHYDATDKPALTIRSGDTVVIHTLLTSSPARLEKAGVAPTQVEPALRAVFDGVPAASRGPGGHILTGPIAIEGAEPGDTLEVRIRKIDLAIPYAIMPSVRARASWSTISPIHGSRSSRSTNAGWWGCSVPA
jgi:hypothetical protein